MKSIAGFFVGVCLLAGTNAFAQAPDSGDLAAPVAQRPQKLTTEMRNKLAAGREKVSADPQYQQLLKEAQAAQVRADDFFLTKLRQVVADDKKLAEHVDEMIRLHTLARSGPSAATSPR